MSSYQINAAAVDFIIKPCADCPDDPERNLRTDINSLQNGGWPICLECGMDLDVEPVAELDLNFGRALLSEEELYQVLNNLVEGMSDNTAWVRAKEAIILWVNTQTREELFTAGYLDK